MGENKYLERRSVESVWGELGEDGRLDGGEGVEAHVIRQEPEVPREPCQLRARELCAALVREGRPVGLAPVPIDCGVPAVCGDADLVFPEVTDPSLPRALRARRLGPLAAHTHAADCRQWACQLENFVEESRGREDERGGGGGRGCTALSRPNRLDRNAARARPRRHWREGGGG